MGLNSLYLSFVFLVCFFLLTGFDSAYAHISYGAFEGRKTAGRNLLQATKACDEDFTNKNYSIITSNCKGPQYPKQSCCGALKEFACPFSDKVNDLSNDCARTMFSYINLYGKYPPGLFANLCREGQMGLACDASPPESPATPLPTPPAFLFLTSASLAVFPLFL